MIQRKVRKDLPTHFSFHWTDPDRTECVITLAMQQYYGTTIKVIPASEKCRKLGTSIGSEYDWYCPASNYWWIEKWLEPPFEYTNEEEI